MGREQELSSDSFRVGDALNPLLNRIILNGFLLLFIQQIFSGIHFQGVLPIIVAAGVLGVINAYIRPFFILLSLPITILTLGLFTLVINGLMLRFTAFLVPGFTIYSFGAAFLGALVMSIINGLFFRRFHIHMEKE